MALVAWPIQMETEDRGSMAYCLLSCEECSTVSCPFHPVHEEVVSVRDIMREDDELHKGTVVSLEFREKNDGSVTITLPYGGLTATDFVENLVRPLMLAIGYHPDSVDEALQEDDCCHLHKDDVCSSIEREKS